MTPSFQRFVAVDWSGAKGPGYRGVAVAECGPGSAAPRSVPAPGGGHWTRSAVARWILDGLGRGPALVGFDMAFSLAFAKAGRRLPEGAVAFDLWAEVERVSAASPDFLGTPYAEAHPEDFWTRGPRPAGYVEARRATELACAAEGLGAPQSPYHLIGSKQVGKGALAGMRVLHALRAAAPGRLAVWPMEEPGPGLTVCVEIYPRLFLRRAGLGSRKVRDGAALDAALRALRSEPAGLAGALGDHDTDALVSAAGLRLLAGVPGAWRPRGLGPEAAARDGWIFGVGAGEWGRAPGAAP
jgi:hypothetical protein